MKNLKEAIKAYTKEGWYPYHMPGHKRHAVVPLGEPTDIDITEIDGFDDLRHPEGILKELQDDAAGIYGSRSCRFLVNGSSVGNLAAIRAALPAGAGILLARNCHISVYNAVMINRLHPVYLYPSGTYPHTGISLAPSAEDVCEKLEEFPDIRAVVITSPGYEGVVSDIRAIADVVHAHNAVLIVDEAHGSHLHFCHKAQGEFRNDFAESAVSLGADLVIQSLHKTMPALNQCALLHNCSDRVPEERLTKALRLFQTTSPSYVLMSSIAGALDWADKNPDAFARYVKAVDKLRNGFKSLNVLRLLDGSDVDPGKITIYDASGQLDGRGLYDEFKKFKLQPEMSAGVYVLFMTSVADDEEGFERLFCAVKAVDERLSATLTAAAFENETIFPETEIIRPEAAMAPFEADAACAERVLLADAVGRIAAEYVYHYPPGIPIVVPGEIITRKIQECLKADGCHGTEDGSICVIRE